MIDTREIPAIETETTSQTTGHTNHPIFIVGSGRSGSTLLSKMLDQHPRLAVPPESHLFIIFQPWLKYYGDLSVPANQERIVNDIVNTFAIRQWSPPLDPQQILSRIRVNNFGGIVDATIASWAEVQGKARWAEKTPSHVYWWREICDYFPEARFIHLMRDGRDVALSYLKAGAGPKTIHSAARRWRRELEEVMDIKASVDASQYHEVRYEELIEEPERVLRGICDFLDEAFYPAMLEFYKEKTAHHKVNKDLDNVNKPLMANNKKKWRRQMTDRDLRIYEAVAGPMLEHLGYERAVPDASLSRAEALYEKLRTYPIKGWGMLRNRTGQTYELNRALIYARLRLIDPLF